MPPVRNALRNEAAASARPSPYRRRFRLAGEVAISAAAFAEKFLVGAHTVTGDRRIMRSLPTDPAERGRSTSPRE